MYAQIPAAGEIDQNLLASMENAKEIIIGVRGVRAAKNIPNKEALTLNVVGAQAVAEDSVIIKIANLEAININAEKDAAAASFMVGTTEYNVPLTNSINVEEELAKLNKDLVYYQGFLATVQKKLSNERFVNNAPAAVVEIERKKQSDAETKIKALQESIAALSKA